jgi:hypothetical protein
MEDCEGGVSKVRKALSYDCGVISIRVKMGITGYLLIVVRLRNSLGYNMQSVQSESVSSQIELTGM